MESIIGINYHLLYSGPTVKDFNDDQLSWRYFAMCMLSYRQASIAPHIDCWGTVARQAGPLTEGKVVQQTTLYQLGSNVERSNVDPEVLKWKINPTYCFDNRGFPNWGGGGPLLGNFSHIIPFFLRTSLTILRNALDVSFYMAPP